jgi:hypothetical protein
MITSVPCFGLIHTRRCLRSSWKLPLPELAVDQVAGKRLVWFGPLRLVEVSQP